MEEGRRSAAQDQGTSTGFSAQSAPALSLLSGACSSSPARPLLFQGEVVGMGERESYAAGDPGTFAGSGSRSRVLGLCLLALAAAALLPQVAE